MAPFQPFDKPALDARPIRAICVGAGLVGIHFASRFREFGKGIDFQIFERNHEVGGTWLNNTYPGIACDVPSHGYTFPSAPFPYWSKYQAPGADCAKYALFLAKRYHAREYIRFNVEVQSADWDDHSGKWQVHCKDIKTGEEWTDQAEVLINSTGLLSQPRYPNLEGIEEYSGLVLHTAQWRSDADFKGKKVALVGLGSSAIQTLPALQEVSEHVDQYCKSTSWIVPLFSGDERDRFFKFGDTKEDGLMSEDPDRVNPTYTEEQKKLLLEDPKAMHAHRKGIIGELNQLFVDGVARKGSETSKGFKELVTRLTEAKLAKSPHLKQFFIPEFAPGCRRPTPGVGFFKAVSAENVTVISAKVTGAWAKGLIDEHGVKREYDAVVFATGFTTDFSTVFPITGRNGTCTRSDAFRSDPKSYMVCNYLDLPNYWNPNGPFLNALNGEFLGGVEKIADYIVKCVLKLQRQRYKSMVCKKEAMDNWIAYADSFMVDSVHTESCSTWYKAGKIQGKPRAIWPGTVLQMLEVLQDPAWEHFDFEHLPGEETGPAQFNWVGNGHGRREVELGDPSYYIPLVEDVFRETPVYGSKEAAWTF